MDTVCLSSHFSHCELCLDLFLIYYWMPEDAGPQYPSNRRVFSFHASLLTGSLWNAAPKVQQSWLWPLEKSSRKQRENIFKCMCYRERAIGINIYLCLSWKHFDFLDFQIHFISHIKFQSGCTKLSIVLCLFLIVAKMPPKIASQRFDTFLCCLTARFPKETVYKFQLSLVYSPLWLACLWIQLRWKVLKHWFLYFNFFNFGNSYETPTKEKLHTYL